MGQDAALQVGVKFLSDIVGQTLGGRIGREGGDKGLQVLGDDLVEKGATGVSRLVDGRYHIQTSRRQRLLGHLRDRYYTFAHYLMVNLSLSNPELWDALLPVVDTLEALDVTYCIGGSVASSFAGVARATLDVDLVADLRSGHAEPLADALTSDYYVDVDMIREAIGRRGTFNVIHLGNG